MDVFGCHSGITLAVTIGQYMYHPTPIMICAAGSRTVWRRACFLGVVAIPFIAGFAFFLSRNSEVDQIIAAGMACAAGALLWLLYKTITVGTSMRVELYPDRVIEYGLFHKTEWPFSAIADVGIVDGDVILSVRTSSRNTRWAIQPVHFFSDSEATTFVIATTTALLKHRSESSDAIVCQS